MFLVSLAAGTPVALLALIAIAACLFSIPSGLKAGLDYGLERRLTRLENIWASEGNGPPLVVRTYTTDTLFERDAARLMQLGYTIQSQHRVFGGNRVTYTLETRR